MTPQQLVWYGLLTALLGGSMYVAYNIRLFAIQTFGPVIHEFDPWFNYRATQYLAKNGLAKFFKWYDHESWYPLGRPVGTTIFPGMQITAVGLWRFLNQVVHYKISLNDVCVYFPAWFGAVATFLLAMLTAECSGSYLAGVVAGAIMSVIPAHLTRSIGGGYDNESLAMSTMCATFLFWCRSLRNQSSWPFGILAGLAYIGMVAAWGGYVFVINMIGIHAAALVLFGRFTQNLHRSYSLWYIIGTLGAIQIPVVGLQPLKSAEQMGPLLVFLGLQVLAYCDLQIKNQKMTTSERNQYIFNTLLKFGVVLAVVAVGLASIGWFGPLSVRVRALFVKHTRTGNPLVDSVAEHQAANPDAYWYHLLHAMYLAPLGMIFCFLQRTDAKLFLVLYGFTTYYFAQKMNRLIILMGPPTSALAGVFLASLLQWSLIQFLAPLGIYRDTLEDDDDTPVEKEKEEKEKEKEEKEDKKEKKEEKGAKKARVTKKGGKNSFDQSLEKIKSKARMVYRSPPGRVLRLIAAVLIIFYTLIYARHFYNYSEDFAQRISQPQLMFKARLSNGVEAIIDDYQESYLWIKKNTPQDARVLSWWDYGYQIAGIANRTTLADGNTWNLEHIALIGKILTSPQPDAHKIARHLADYVLVWSGGGGDDLAKSPHMARIASSVYDNVCPGDPDCNHFGMGQDPRTGQHVPTEAMSRSLLFHLIQNGKVPGIEVDSRLFQEVYQSKYGLVRVYKIMDVSQESKKWLADPANRVCDAPGSWYCVGRYPPAITPPPKTHRYRKVD